jgi:hypothetical protein
VERRPEAFARVTLAGQKARWRGRRDVGVLQSDRPSVSSVS